MQPLGDGNPFLEASDYVLVLTLFPEAVWNSVVSVATEDRRFLHTTHSAVPFCELVWPVAETLLFLEVFTSQ